MQPDQNSAQDNTSLPAGFRLDPHVTPDAVLEAACTGTPKISPRISLGRIHDASKDQEHGDSHGPFVTMGRRMITFKDPETELEEIARAQHSPELQELVRWYLHPDERVAVAAVRAKFLSANWGNKKAETLYSILLRRAVLDASAHHEVWTPLMDAMSEVNLWSDSAAVPPELMRRSDQLRARVLPMIKQTRDVHALMALAERSRSPHLLPLIALHAPEMPLELARIILAQYPEAVADLCMRATLSTEVRDYALDYVIRMAFATSHPFDRQFFQTSIQQAARLLFFNHQARLSDERFEHLSLARMPKQTTKGVTVEDFLPSAFDVLEHYFLATKDEDLLIRFCTLAKSARDFPNYVKRLLLLHRMDGLPFTPRVAHTLFDYRVPFNYDILAEIAQSPVLRMDSGVRPLLLKSNDIPTIRALLSDQCPDDFRMLFLKLARVAPHWAADALMKYGEIAGKVLQAEDLVPLLSSSMPEVRMATMRFLSKFDPTHGHGRISEGRRRRRKS